MLLVVTSGQKEMAKEMICIDNRHQWPADGDAHVYKAHLRNFFFFFLSICYFAGYLYNTLILIQVIRMFFLFSHDFIGFRSAFSPSHIVWGFIKYRAKCWDGDSHRSISHKYSNDAKRKKNQTYENKTKLRKKNQQHAIRLKSIEELVISSDFNIFFSFLSLFPQHNEQQQSSAWQNNIIICDVIKIKTIFFSIRE